MHPRCVDLDTNRSDISTLFIDILSAGYGTRALHCIADISHDPPLCATVDRPSLTALRRYHCAVASRWGQWAGQTSIDQGGSSRVELNK